MGGCTGVQERVDGGVYGGAGEGRWGGVRGCRRG